MGFSGGYEVGEDLTWPEILSWSRSVVLLQYAPGNMRTDFFVTVLILWLIVVFAVISQWLLQYKPVLCIRRHSGTVGRGRFAHSIDDQPSPSSLRMSPVQSRGGIG